MTLVRAGSTRLHERHGGPAEPGPSDLRSVWRQQYETRAPWGIAASVDIYHCDPLVIRDADAITRYTHELCELIGMRRFGDTQVVHFGDDPKVSGYSMVQLIETSLLSGHFANETNTAYLDIFSCKYYEPETVAAFARDFFGGDRHVLNVTMRD